MKIQDGRRKHILKKVAATLLPDEILGRPKQGFAVPLNVWFRGGLTDVFADTLLSSRALSRGYFDVGFIRQLIGEHVAGKRDHALRLWQLVVFERWHREYVDAHSGGSGLPISAPALPPQAMRVAG
jgi:asparagine synthase (glutamine-hydrolysing)